MPLYRFVCSSCGEVEKHLLAVSLLKDFKDESRCCSKALVRTLGSSQAPQALETRDEHRGKSVLQGVEQLIEDRSTEHQKKSVPSSPD